VRAGKGTTVASIASKYQVTASSIAQWNGVSTSASFKNKQAVILFLPQSQARKSSRSENSAKPARAVGAVKPVAASAPEQRKKHKKR
jgi:membrane-bound lytic murein transglycosylase D